MRFVWYHAVALALVPAACAGPPMEPPGISSAPHGTQSKADAAADVELGAWTELQTASGWEAAGPEFLSQGHAAGRYLATVRVSPEAMEAYRRLVTGFSVPTGAWVVKFHRDAKSEEPGPVYAMHKAQSGWEFLVVDPGGAIRERGALPLCQRCHAEAVADHLFGVARAKTPADAGSD